MRRFVRFFVRFFIRFFVRFWAASCVLSRGFVVVPSVVRFLLSAQSHVAFCDDVICRPMTSHKAGKAGPQRRTRTPREERRRTHFEAAARAQEIMC